MKQKNVWILCFETKKIFLFLKQNKTKIQTQLTLEQHGFELRKSTYIWIFFNRKYYSTTQPEVGSQPELLIQRSTIVSYIWTFDCAEGQHPWYTVQGSTVPRILRMTADSIQIQEQNALVFTRSYYHWFTIRKNEIRTLPHSICVRVC